MLDYIIRRVAFVPIIFLGLTALVFILLQLSPVDPVVASLGETPVDAETIQEMREKLGLDQPVYVQYLKYLDRIIRGDLGKSLISNRPVTTELSYAIPFTLQLTSAALLWAIVIGLPIGILSAIKQYSLIDQVSRIFAVIGVSTPSFWLALLLILIVGFNLGILPLSGTGGIEYLVLPSLTLGLIDAGVIVRLVRSSMLEILREDYITVAYAKGLKNRTVVIRHALRNALIPFVTMIGIQFGTLLSGSFLVEAVFSWPGLGRLALVAIDSRDYPLITGAVLITSIAFVMANLIVDVLYSYIDPRIRYGKGED